MKRKNRYIKYILLSSFIALGLIMTAPMPAAADEDEGEIPVDNRVLEEEEGFSAQDLGEYLENMECDDEEPSNSADAKDWKLILVNKQNPIPEDYDAKLVEIRKGAVIRREIAYPLARMFEAAQEDGISLVVCSAYRSHEYQQMLFERKIRNYTRMGLSYLDAFRLGSYSVIIPGTSEHELGMALDIVTPGYMNLNEGFADTDAGKWLKENAYKFGFILRYPEGKEYITGITFEPWHYRYVGKDAAQEITERDITLEEYIDELDHSGHLEDRK
ncbi:MAG: M15 family metallopeptidase [Lachnospiraceae bacterium]|nr:M15 family metallopeptidase [Lachnospiraceae bacterium]